MNKDLETLRSKYFELSRSFLMALQHDRPSNELELIRQQIKDVVVKMEELGSSEPSPEQS